MPYKMETLLTNLNSYVCKFIKHINYVDDVCKCITDSYFILAHALFPRQNPLSKQCLDGLIKLWKTWMMNCFDTDLLP